MTQTISADIIPFPARPVREAQAPAITAQDRLAVALANLDQAMAEQRVAMAAWRGALDELKASARSLGDGLQRYRGTLNTLGADVAALREESVKLGEWADGVVAREKSGRHPL